MEKTPLAESWGWNGQTLHGQESFSGVYLYVIQDSEQVKTGKITIIR